MSNKAIVIRSLQHNNMCTELCHQCGRIVPTNSEIIDETPVDAKSETPFHEPGGKLKLSTLLTTIQSAYCRKCCIRHHKSEPPCCYKCSKWGSFQWQYWSLYFWVISDSVTLISIQKDETVDADSYYFNVHYIMRVRTEPGSKIAILDDGDGGHYTESERRSGTFPWAWSFYSRHSNHSEYNDIFNLMKPSGYDKLVMSPILELEMNLFVERMPICHSTWYEELSEKQQDDKDDHNKWMKIMTRAFARKRIEELVEKEEAAHKVKIGIITKIIHDGCIKDIDACDLVIQMSHPMSEHLLIARRCLKDHAPIIDNGPIRVMIKSEQDHMWSYRYILDKQELTKLPSLLSAVQTTYYEYMYTIRQVDGENLWNARGLKRLHDWDPSCEFNFIHRNDIPKVTRSGGFIFDDDV